MWSSAAGQRAENGFLRLPLVAAAISCGFALAAAWHWPLVGDAALMRYVVFLLHGGSAPYREIVDVNWPGSYALTALAMRLFGAGAVGLRLYDGALCALACAGAIVLGGRGLRAQLCGAMAGLLFVLIHLRDGVVQAGQRDLAMAVIALLALVLLLRVRGWVGIAGFELLVGLTLVVKPTLFLLAVLPLYAAWVRRERLSPGAVAGGTVTLLAPLAAGDWWLWRRGSLLAFWQMLGSIERTHGALARRGVLFLLGHAVAPIGILLVLGLACWGLQRFAADAEWKTLVAAAGCGLISFLIQQKGFPYQRYTVLALVLICIFRVVALGLASAGWARSLALAIVGLSCLWLAPRFAWTVAKFERRAPFEQALSADLTTRKAGPGDVQCLDTVGGCIATLNRMGLRQSTGYLYDCYAYVGPKPAQAAFRAGFLAALERARPRLIVLSSQYCLGAADDFGRVARWPELEQMLANDYLGDTQWEPASRIRWWNETELPPSYRIYARR